MYKREATTRKRIDHTVIFSIICLFRFFNSSIQLQCSASHTIEQG